MRDLLFPSPPLLTAALREAGRASARAFVVECRAMVAMFQAADADQQEFVAGEVACVLHLAPATADGRLTQALSVLAQPRLVAALEAAQLGVGHALALLSEVEHLEAEHAGAVLAAVLGEDPSVELDATAGELRSLVKRAILIHDPELARARHERAKQTAGVRTRPLPDGMAQLIVDCTAVRATIALAAVRGRAQAMSFQSEADGQELTAGQQQVAALLHALGCDRTRVQAVIECPVERAVDLHAAGNAPVWTVDARMPAAVALGLSDHPAVLAGYGPIDACEARALLPQADLVKACVDATTGEVLTVDPPARAKTWQAGDPDQARALRDRLVAMATSGGTLTDLTVDGYVPTEALGRLIDLRDVTSTFPGDTTAARRCDRDHRLPWPLGPTSAGNLQNTSRRWHRAKHTGWTTHLLPDGTIRWTSPTGGVYHRKTQRTPPPPIPPGATLPPLDDPGAQPAVLAGE